MNSWALGIGASDLPVSSPSELGAEGVAEFAVFVCLFLASSEVGQKSSVTLVAPSFNFNAQDEGDISININVEQRFLNCFKFLTELHRGVHV